MSDYDYTKAMKTLGADKSPFTVATTKSSVIISYQNVRPYSNDPELNVIFKHNVHLCIKQNKSSLKRVEKLISAYQNVNGVVSQTNTTDSSVFNADKFNKTTVDFKELGSSIKESGGASVFFRNNNITKTLFDAFKSKCQCKYLQELSITINSVVDYEKGDRPSNVISILEFDTTTYMYTVNSYIFDAGQAVSNTDNILKFFKINYSIMKQLTKTEPTIADVFEKNKEKENVIEATCLDFNAFSAPQLFKNEMFGKLLGVDDLTYSYQTFGVYRKGGKLALVKNK